MNLEGKKAFIAGVGDDQGYGWAIAKALFEAGVEVLLGTWVPVFKIFQLGLRNNKFACSTAKGSFSPKKIYPLDVAYDTQKEIPEEVLTHRRYKDFSNYAIADVAAMVAKDEGAIDILVHSVANGPEVKRPLLETSRGGYLSAMSSSSYSFTSLVKHFGLFMNPDSSALCLSYIAANAVIPKYGGGMSSAKAALESDVKMLAYEAAKRWGMRINCISAGPLASRAATAIGMIDEMIVYAQKNNPLQKSMQAEDVAKVACFLLSSDASCITGSTIYADNGFNIMGMAVDPSTADLEAVSDLSSL